MRTSLHVEVGIELRVVELPRCVPVYCIFRVPVVFNLRSFYTITYGHGNLNNVSFIVSAPRPHSRNVKTSMLFYVTLSRTHIPPVRNSGATWPHLLTTDGIGRKLGQSYCGRYLPYQMIRHDPEARDAMLGRERLFGTSWFRARNMNHRCRSARYPTFAVPHHSVSLPV